MTDAINHEEERPHHRPERSVDGGFRVAEGDYEGRRRRNLRLTIRCISDAEPKPERPLISVSAGQRPF